MQPLDYINILLLFGGLFLITLEIFLGIDSAFDLILSGLSLFLAGSIGFILWNVWISGLVLSIIFLNLYWVLGRKYIHENIQVESRSSNIDNIVGQRGVVKRLKSNHSLVVNVCGEEWSAESRVSLESGDIILVDGLNGNLLLVSKP